MRDAPVRRFDSGRLHQGGSSAQVFTSLGERAPRSVDNHAVGGMGRVRPRRRSTSISMRLLMIQEMERPPLHAALGEMA